MILLWVWRDYQSYGGLNTLRRVSMSSWASEVQESLISESASFLTLFQRKLAVDPCRKFTRRIGGSKQILKYVHSHHKPKTGARGRWGRNELRERVWQPDAFITRTLPWLLTWWTFHTRGGETRQLFPSLCLLSSVSHLTAAHSTWTGVVLISTFPTKLGCPEMTQEPMFTDRERPASDFCSIFFRAREWGKFLAPSVMWAA